MNEKLEKLLGVDVSPYVEKKGGLSYLSWANAWREFIKVHPGTTYTIQKNADGKCWFGDSATGYMVYTAVTVDGLTHEMWLPVMDHRNKAVKEPDSFQINKAVMRCLTKNLAMFGLGLSLYAGEDIPQETKEDTLVKDTRMLYANIRKTILTGGNTQDNVDTITGIDMVKVAEIVNSKDEKAIKALHDKLKKVEL